MNFAVFFVVFVVVVACKRSHSCFALLQMIETILFACVPSICVEVGSMLIANYPFVAGVQNMETSVR